MKISRATNHIVKMCRTVGYDNRSGLIVEARAYLASLKDTDGLDSEDQREVLLNLLPKMSDWDLEVSMSKGKVGTTSGVFPSRQARQRRS